MFLLNKILHLNSGLNGRLNSIYTRGKLTCLLEMMSEVVEDAYELLVLHPWLLSQLQLGFSTEISS